ncbi:arrestin domain-containing protein 17-like [Calliopsis andreniformis]|uniref:arrestin domain-containing protein 17-like n=1 Tax=Calliopsis andreniformis TaxID=337506 RepID=UPI003FCDB66B
MPSLKKFCVEFDRPSVTYAPGETVTGDIIVEISKAKNIRELYVSAKGKAHVEWSESRSYYDAQQNLVTETAVYSDTEDYFNFKFTILGARDSFPANVQVEIPPGYHRYPFVFKLPCSIPNSFQHPIGYVRYTVKGVIDRTWRFDRKCSAIFTVLSVLDLNSCQERCLGVDDEVTRNFCCFWCIDLGSLNMRIRVPTLGYVPGQRVSAMIDYENSSSSVQVTKIELKLEQVLNFHTLMKTKTACRTVACSKMNVPFATNAQIVPELLLPSLPPSHLPFCLIIDISYKLNIIVHVSGTHFAVKKIYFPIIGTIPLNSSSSAPLLNELKDVPKSEEIVEKSSEVHIPLLMPISPNAPNPAGNQSS